MVWIENWLNGEAQRVVVSGTKFNERPVAIDVPQGSVLGPVLFNIFINDLDLLRIPSAHLQIKLELVAAIQRDLDKLEKWADRIPMQFNKEKCKVLRQGRSSHVHQYILGASCLESRLAEKDQSGHQIENEPAICPCCKKG